MDTTVKYSEATLSTRYGNFGIKLWISFNPYLSKITELK